MGKLLGNAGNILPPIYKADTNTDNIKLAIEGRRYTKLTKLLLLSWFEKSDLEDIWDCT